MKHVFGISYLIILLTLFSCKGDMDSGSNINSFSKSTNSSYDLKVDVREVNTAIAADPNYSITQEEIDLLQEDGQLTEQEYQELALLINK